MRPELADESATLHAQGDYIALPPVTLGHLRTRWCTQPLDNGNSLPSSDEVQRHLVDALRGGASW